MLLIVSSQKTLQIILKADNDDIVGQANNILWPLLLTWFNFNLSMDK